MKKRLIWVNLSLISCVGLLNLAMPLSVRAHCHGAIRREVREGAREIIRERREAAREVLRSDNRFEARREVREGIREVQRERREMRREVRREIRRRC